MGISTPLSYNVAYLLVTSVSFPKEAHMWLISKSTEFINMPVITASCMFYICSVSPGYFVIVSLANHNRTAQSMVASGNHKWCFNDFYEF